MMNDLPTYRPLATGLLLTLLGCQLLNAQPAATQLLATTRHSQPIHRAKAVVSTRDALAELERRYNVTIGYAATTLDNRPAPSDEWMQAKDLKTALNRLLSPQNLTVKQVKKDVYIVKPANRSGSDAPATASSVTANGFQSLGADFGQAIAVTVRGRVTGDDGQGIPGVSIVLKGTNTGTVTNTDGDYSLTVPDANGTLVFSFIGYTSQEVPVNNRASINVTLKNDIQQLGEVVVVGYGTQEKKDVTGAISAVKGADIQNLPSGGAQQALQGRAAGVNVVRNGGAPGNAGSIRIRGLGTVNNADPLIVIDGVPAGSMNDVNPNDIESIDVLKDASASAIYGTRAANGVVLITTKRGRFDDKLRFTVNGYTGVSNRIKTLPVLDAPTLAAIKREAYTNDGLTVPAIWQDTQYQTQQTNWQDQILRQGTTQNLDVALRGGGKYSSFAISGGYYNETGIIGNSYYKRYTFRINSDHKITERLKIGQNLQFTNTHDNAPNTLSAQDGLLWSAIRFHPGLPVMNADGTYSTTQGKGAFGDINNPQYTIDTQDKDNARNRLLGSVTGEFEIVKGLKARANLALDATFTNTREFGVKITDQYRTNQYNQLTLTNDKYWAFLQEYFLSYDKSFGQHTVGLVGGYTSQTFNDLYSGTRGRDFASEDADLRYMRYAGSIVAIGNGQDGGRSYDALQSVFGRGTYAYKDRYLLTATFRADGSSKFAPGNKWGYFPAFSLGWRISDEPFFKNALSTISNLKLTGGWGQLGNQNISSLQYLALINSNYRYSFGDQNTSGSAQGRLANANIGWETAEMSNFGLDAGFLQNRLQASINYFIKDTKNMLLSPPSLGTLGRASIPDQNVGQLRNQGLELELSYQQKVGDLTLSVSGNATFIKNRITKLLTPGSFLGSQTYGRTDQEITRSYEGYAYGTFYGWRTNGLYQTQGEIDADPALAKDPRRTQGLIHPGDVRFQDLNGDGVIDNNDRTILGSPQPKVTYGLNTGLTYKGFDFTLFFLGQGGVDIYNADRMQGLDASYSFNLYADETNRWTGPNTSNSIPRVSINNSNRNFRTSDLFIERGDFLRLKNLTLGYTIPKPLMNRLGLSQARIYVTGQNVLTFTKYSGLNPELGFADGDRSQGQYAQQNVDYAQYPQARTFTLGATLAF
ncbi:SusC/RagA family TonB-linked outer membrane protein [Spirosoma rhododendri]|uniref:TonB-dependent receptor n=1 Tax=Spirosoma rhododendri TaxID=2728024 RepID=A0A7L5DLH3_9BACT|nr:TonB-dependent receptor [Spirosoma rhododendri]QJD79319.1 TonB-dependent receptor [Spirosoma rhododendri]